MLNSSEFDILHFWLNLLWKFVALNKWATILTTSSRSTVVVKGLQLSVSANHKMNCKIPCAFNPEWRGRFGGFISRNVHAKTGFLAATLSYPPWKVIFAAAATAQTLSPGAIFTSLPTGWKRWMNGSDGGNRPFPAKPLLTFALNAHGH